MNARVYRQMLFTVLTLILVGVVMLSCREAAGSGEEAEDGVRIISGAYSAADTRVEYEEDGVAGVRRVVWSEGDELKVAAFAGGERVNASGRVWSRFGMVTDEGFDKDYMLFAGDALIPADGSGTNNQRLYAFYPAKAITDPNEDKVIFSAIQKYRKGSFDTDAVIMVSAPVEAALPAAGELHTSPFRFRHYTGYLRLFPKGLPATVAGEKVAKIIIEASAGTALSGAFNVYIDDASQEWRMEPAGGNSNVVEIDCSESGMAVAELAECWCAMLPGSYDSITISIHTDTGSVVTMKRLGLEIKPGVIKEQDLNFRSGDELRQAVVVKLDGSDLGIGEYAQTEVKTGSKQGVDFSYTKLRYVVSGDVKHVEWGKRNSKLWNTSPLPSRIVRLEVECDDAFSSRFVSVSMGETTDYTTSETGLAEGINLVYAPANADCRFISIENVGTGTAVIRSVRIICEPAN